MVDEPGSSSNFSSATMCVHVGVLKVVCAVLGCIGPLLDAAGKRKWYVVWHGGFLVGWQFSIRFLYGIYTFYTVYIRLYGL